MAYALAVREHIMGIKKKEGLTFMETSARFGVPLRTLQRWDVRIEPKRRACGATKVDMEGLRADVAERPDDYQYERAARFGVGPGAIAYALRRLGLTNKKKPAPPKGRRGQAAGLRRADGRP